MSMPMPWMSVRRGIVLLLCSALYAAQDCSISLDQYEALQDFYDATNGPSWCLTASQVAWNFPSSTSTLVNTSAPCDDQWVGVSCVCNVESGNATIAELRLSSLCLSGTIPASIDDLSDLQALDLSNPLISTTTTTTTSAAATVNTITGAIPSSITNLASLAILSLTKNTMTGPIPSGLGVMTALTAISLEHNYFSGTLPADLFTAQSPLVLIALGVNSIRGTIPSTIGSLSVIEDLQLENNLLVGSLPSEICQLSSLRSLSLTKNALTGSLPPAITQLKSLAYFLLSANMFAGTIPPGLITPSLKVFGMADNLLVGSIPSTIDRATALLSIDLTLNRLTGTIPSGLFLISTITEVRLSNNHLLGWIPATLVNATALELLYVDSNELIGPIPTALANLQRLSKMNLNDNELTGPIPEELSYIPLLTSIQLYDNFLTGTIPVSLVNNTWVSSLSLAVNELTGSLPPEIGDSQLTYFAIYDNQLTGTIPSHIFANTAMTQLVVYGNKLIGTLPSEITKAISLENLSVNNNRLTGTIPPELASMSKLVTLDMGFNRFTGTIPSTFTPSAKLRFLLVKKNYLTGAIPDALFQISGLGGLNAEDNLLSGVLPSSLQSSSALQELIVGSNVISGTLPDLSKVSELTALTIFSNYLEGTIPSSINQLSRLMDILVNDNFLTGSFFHVYDAQLHPQLRLINSANNLLTGSIAAGFFHLPELSAVSMSSNCFIGSIPESICSAASTLSVIDFDSMGGNSGCVENKALNDNRPPFVNGMFSRLGLEGTIPGCLANFTALTTLHLSGNQLVGTIPSFGTSSNKDLIDLSLSNNALTGSIPTSVQLHSFEVLDLSNNRLDGTLIDGFVVSPGQTKVALAVNRLSGSLPSALRGLSSSSGTNLTSLNVLTSNIFACSTDEIPSLDAHSQSYSCGSYELEVAAYLWLSVGAFLAVIALCLGLTVRYFQQQATQSEAVKKALNRFLKLRVTSLNWLRAGSKVLDASTATAARSFPQILVFLVVLHAIREWTKVIGVVLILLVLPVYLGLDDVASIVSFGYGFEPSVTFLHGLAPVLFVAVLILVLLVSLAVLGRALNRLIQQSLAVSTPTASTLNHAESTATAAAAETDGVDWKRQGRGYLLLFATHAVNFTTTLAVNAAYVNAILNSNLSRTQLLAIQASIGIFKLVWNGLYIPWSTRLAANFLQQENALRSRLIMSLVNFIIAPCLATIAVNQSCFYFAFNSLPEVDSAVTLTIVSDFSLCKYGFCTTLILSDTVSFSTKAVPTFRYSYACGTALLEAYIPVLLYSYVAYCFVVPLIRIWLTVNVSWIKANAPPQLVMLLLVLYDENSTKRVIGRRIIVGLTVHGIILLTFGVASPVLGICVVAGIITDCMLSQAMAGRILWRHCPGIAEGSEQRAVNDGIIKNVADIDNDDEDDVIVAVHSNPLHIEMKSRSSAKAISQSKTIVEPSSPVILPSPSPSISIGDDDGSIKALSVRQDSQLSQVSSSQFSTTSEREGNLLQVTEQQDMKDSWSGLFACFDLLVVTVSVFWSLLFFDMIADGYGVSAGIATSAVYGLSVPILVLVIYHMPSTNHRSNWVIAQLSRWLPLQQLLILSSQSSTFSSEQGRKYLSSSADSDRSRQISSLSVTAPREENSEFREYVAESC